MHTHLLLTLLIGAVPSGRAEDARAAATARVCVVTSFYPVYVAALNVVRDAAAVELVSLTGPAGGCLHDYQLTPGNRQLLTRAHIFVANGAGMESFLGAVAGQTPAVKVVNASRGIELLPAAPERDARPHAAGAGEEFNPHVWLSPTLYIRQVRNIANGLAEHDPPRAELYRRNAGDYVRQIEGLRTRMREGLKDIKRRDIVTGHDAFPYLAREFGLNVVAVVEREPGAEPGAGQMAAIVRAMRGAGVRTIFVEPQYSPKAAAAIAKEAGARILTLDPAVTGDATPDAYLRAMERNLAALEEALK